MAEERPGDSAVNRGENSATAAEASPPSAPDEDADASAPQPDEARHPPPPLPKGTTVLHIGDSFAGALGIDLNREFKNVGIKGVLKYETSSYIPTWAWSKDLDTYLLRWRPDLVLVTLGANELLIEDPTDRIKTIRRLVDRISERPCIWIGPPLWEGARSALLDVIRDNVSPCLYMDSTALLPELPRARDKIHPTMDARKDWARFVVDWLARQREPNGNRPWSLKPVSTRNTEAQGE